MEILCEEHAKLLTFSWLQFVSLMTGRNPLTHTKKLKMEFKYILFRKPPFSRSMLSLCENENTPIRGKRIAP